MITEEELIRFLTPAKRRLFDVFNERVSLSGREWSTISPRYVYKSMYVRVPRVIHKALAYIVETNIQTNGQFYKELALRIGLVHLKHQNRVDEIRTFRLTEQAFESFSQLIRLSKKSMSRQYLYYRMVRGLSKSDAVALTGISPTAVTRAKHDAVRVLQLTNLINAGLSRCYLHHP